MLIRTSFYWIFSVPQLISELRKEIAWANLYTCLDSQSIITNFLKHPISYETFSKTERSEPIQRSGPHDSKMWERKNEQKLSLYDHTGHILMKSTGQWNHKIYQAPLKYPSLDSWADQEKQRMVELHNWELAVSLLYLLKSTDKHESIAIDVDVDSCRLSSQVAYWLTALFV